MGQWKPYSCISQIITTTQAAGTTSEANTPAFRATSDDNEGIVYQVVFQAATTDTFYVKKSTDGGSTFQSYYAAPHPSTDVIQPGSHDEDKDVFMSIDAGVEIAVPFQSNLVNNDAFQFTVPTLEKRYDGGIHAFIEIGYSAGTTEGSCIIYSEDIPFNFKSGFTMYSNARNLSYIYNQTDILGNAGTSVDLQWTVDGTNYIDGFELTDDANWSVLEDRGKITVYDKGDATGTAPLETGGDTLKYRLRVQFEDLDGGEKILSQRQYGHFAIYKH